MSYGNPDIALNCGTITRDCIKNEALCRIVLQSQVFWALFDTVANAQFEIATDAFSTISDALCTHQKTAAEFLTHNQTKFVSKMTMLMTSDNYVTQRQSLKLVSTLIRKRSNYNFMTFYISDAANLRPVMVLLRNKSPIMRFEAFQIFKIFVANPKKTKPVTEILFRNKTKLVDFLKTFTSPDKKEDETFNDERNFIISQLTSLQLPGNSNPQQQQQLPQTAQLQHQLQQMQLQQQQQSSLSHQVVQGNYGLTPMSMATPGIPSSASTAMNTPSSTGVAPSQHGYFPVMPTGFNGNANTPGDASKQGYPNNNSPMMENPQDFPQNARNLNGGASNASLNSFHAQHSTGAANGSNGSVTPGSGLSVNSGASRLKPQFIGAVGSGAVLNPIVQTDQVLHFPSAISQNSQSPGIIGLPQLPISGSSSNLASPNGMGVVSSSNSALPQSNLSMSTSVTTSATTTPSTMMTAATTPNFAASSNSLPFNKPSPSSSPASSDNSLSRNRSYSITQSQGHNGGNLPMAHQQSPSPSSSSIAPPHQPILNGGSYAASSPTKNLSASCTTNSSASNSNSSLHMMASQVPGTPLYSSPPSVAAARLVSQQ